MKTIKQCEKLTNPQLLAEISNRNSLIQAMPGSPKSLTLVDEVAKLWELMSKNGYKK